MFQSSLGHVRFLLGRGRGPLVSPVQCGLGQDHGHARTRSGRGGAGRSQPDAPGALLTKPVALVPRCRQREPHLPSLSGTDPARSIPGWHANPQRRPLERALGLTWSPWVSGASPRRVLGPSGSESGSLPWRGTWRPGCTRLCWAAGGCAQTLGGEAVGREEGWGEGGRGGALGCRVPAAGKAGKEVASDAANFSADCRAPPVRAPGDAERLGRAGLRGAGEAAPPRPAREPLAAGGGREACGRPRDPAIRGRRPLSPLGPGLEGKRREEAPGAAVQRSSRRGRCVPGSGDAGGPAKGVAFTPNRFCLLGREGGLNCAAQKTGCILVLPPTS